MFLNESLDHLQRKRKTKLRNKKKDLTRNPVKIATV